MAFKGGTVTGMIVAGLALPGSAAHGCGILALECRSGPHDHGAAGGGQQSQGPAGDSRGLARLRRIRPAGEGRRRTGPVDPGPASDGTGAGERRPRAV